MTQANTKTSGKLTAQDHFESSVRSQKKRKIDLKDSEEEWTLPASRSPRQVAQTVGLENQNEDLSISSDDDDLRPSSPRSKPKPASKERGEIFGSEGIIAESHKIQPSRNTLDTDVSEDHSQWGDMDESSGHGKQFDSSSFESRHSIPKAQYSSLQEDSDDQSASRDENNPSNTGLPKYLALLLRRRAAQEHAAAAVPDAMPAEPAPAQKKTSAIPSYPRPSENDHSDEVMTALSWRARDRHRKTGMHPLNRPLEDMSPAFKRVYKDWTEKDGGARSSKGDGNSAGM
ncbi:hypothetical protein BKA63DRAFT_486337 [Paraphoma chrysanthemicola]|nr:hypothetical protein BKA63DRAFT_486337 [Paraphoma chrysanthemicola]